VFGVISVFFGIGMQFVLSPLVIGRFTGPAQKGICTGCGYKFGRNVTGNGLECGRVISVTADDLKKPDQR